MWTPPAVRNLCIDTFVNHVSGHLNTFIKSKKNLNFHNLTAEEKKGLSNPMTDREIVIRKADKGGAINLLHQEDYKEEILKQLNNKTFYKKLDYDPTTIYIQELKILINNIEQPHTKTHIMPLVPTCPKPVNFYAIPTIHKLSNMEKQFFTEHGNKINVHDINDIITLAKDLKIFPPCRQIVSGIGTLTENISSFIDSILQRLMLFIPSYIKDTKEFINKLASIKTIPSDVLLVTMDVTSLYANIPHIGGVDACCKFLNDHCVTDISTDVLCSLISFILTHNNFVFDDHDYLQTSGTAMGTKMALCFANTFMASIELIFIDSSPLTPLFFVRFIDDIFIIWTHGSEELEQFTSRANSTHPCIKLTTEISSTSLPFLDVLVCVTDTSIKTSICRKPTDRPTYLMYHSFHPQHIKSSIIFSQHLRLKRMCSDISDYEHEVKILTQSHLYRGCPYKLISKQINNASHIVRTKSLTRNSNKNTNEKRITFITQFHQSIATSLKNVNKDWLNIRTDNRFNNKLSNPIILAYKQPRNLQQWLTRSKNTFLQCNQPCHKPRCKVSSHIDIRCSIKFDNDVTLSAAKADCDSQ